jgi:hypothetical protein
MNGTNNNHDPSSLMDRILFLLRDRQQQTAATIEVTRKAIHKNLTSSSSSDVTKKDVKKALKQLVKRGDLMKDGKKYKLQSSSLLSSNDNESESNNSSDDGSRSSSASVLGEEEVEETAPFVPIAQRIRQTTQQVKQSSDTNNQDIGSNNPKQAVDLDEEIRRLEAELAQSSDDNDDEDESDDYDDASDNGCSDDIRNSSSSTAPQDNGIICLSSVADERIAPLPHAALPQNKRRTLKNIDSVGDSSGQNATKRKSKKRKKSSQGEKEEEHTISEGLKDAVNELLQNYVPSSHLKKPFYCRVCQHQSESEADFLSHKQSEFHRGAVQQERKRTYCKLCRKQLTSIVQMEEHLKSRPHREKMDFVKSKQNGGGGRGGFRNQGGRHGRDASGKQWC